MKRQNNQDAFCALGGPDAPEGCNGLIAVADGMGGHSAGEIASSMAIDLLLAELRRTHRKSKRNSGTGPDLKTVVQHIGGRLHRESMRPNQKGMGTTLTAVALANDSINVAHIGDSRAYLLNNGVLRQLTRDHSWVSDQVAAGLMDPIEAINHPRRNVLTQALGPRQDVEIDSSNVQVEAGDVVIVCSDGLYTLLSDMEIATVVSQNNPQNACEQLVQVANSRGGNDNVTAVVMGILGKSSLEAQLAEVSLARDSMVKRARAWLAKILTF